MSLDVINTTYEINMNFIDCASITHKIKDFLDRRVFPDFATISPKNHFSI